MFFFQLPYLPELMISLEDYGIFDMFGKASEKAYVHPLSKEEIEAYKYTFSQPGWCVVIIKLVRISPLLKHMGLKNTIF